jgi:GT2 family glycosyltransferase
MSTDNLAIVLLNWEQAHQTLEAIRMISSWKGMNPLIIIVDNGSSESDRSILQKGVNRHCLILNRHNKGYAGGNNDGVALAIAKECTKILLLNSDVGLGEECIGHLISCLEMNPDIGVIGPLLEVEGKTFAGGRDIALYSTTQVPFNKHKNAAAILPVEYVSGTVFLFRAEIFEEVGPLVEDYFFSGEIADFCYNIRKAGYLCAVSTECSAVHTRIATFHRNTLYPYYSLRNRFLYIMRNKQYFSSVLMLRWVISGIFYSSLAYLRRNRVLSCVLITAVKDGIQGTFGNQHKRILSKVCPNSADRE